MITADYLSVEFEGEERKTTELTKTCVAMTAGDALAHAEVFGGAKAAIDSASISQVTQIVEKVKEAFVDERKKRFEEHSLKPRGLTLGEFYRGGQRSLDPTIAMKLDRECENAELKMQMIIAGTDNTGAHLYCLSDPGVSQCFDALKFCGYGSGYPHAMSTLIFNNYHVKMGLAMSVYLVYEAKRRAEAAPGVGKQYTDLAIISNRIRYLTEEELDQLDKVYQVKVALQKPKEVDDMIGKLSFER
jgi:hypothetical protein